MKNITFPCMNTRMVPIAKMKANNYNPNSVAPPEKKLLKRSIEEDGFTQPIVCYYDKEKDLYIIVDGFHRYECAIEFELDMAPVVVIEKSLKERMASTIRHNRARGKHGIDGMVNIVSEMKLNGWSDSQVAKELGMDSDEVLRLTQAAGLPELFKDHEYSRSWVSEEDLS